MTTPTSRRRRILTERGMDLYQQTVQELKGKLRDAKEELDTFLSSSERSTKELSYLELLDKQVKFESLFKKYRDRYQHISEYLQRQNTDISNIDMYQLQSTEEHDQGKYQQMKANIVESIKVQRLDSVSVITTESKVSKRSKTSSSSGSIRTILAVKRAEAAAAKVKLEFAKKEAEIKKDQAELEVNQAIVNAEKIRKQKLFENELNILKSKELAEVCAAEADALENETLSQSDIDEKLNIKQISKEENMDRFFKSFQPQQQEQQQQQLDVKAPEFVPSRPENTENNLITFSDSRVNMQNQTKVESQMELSKFLVKRELLTSRLGLFNNRPENFGSWSASFQSVMKDLDVTSMEEVGPQADGGERSDHRAQRQGDKDKNPDGGERAPTAEGKVGTHCTQICGNVKVNGKSCAKIVLVDVYSKHNDSNRVRTYAILDEQSNRSLASPELFRKLNPTTEQIQYTLNTCAGPSEVVGQKAMYCVIEAADGSSKYNLPPLLECSSIPNVRDEIPTPEIASHFSHLQDVAPFIPSLDQDAQILLLIGRDLGAAHHVIEQVVGPDNGPFAQRLSLGWVVIGQVCLGQMHLNDTVSCNKTVLLQNGRPSHFQPCSNKFIVSEQGLYEDLFVKTANDDRLGLSVEDKVFLNVMDREMVKDPSGNWIAPLPFKPQRPKLPNNRAYALNRATLLHTSLSKNPRKKEHFVTFMDQIIGRGHAEIAPQIHETKERWYLQLFGVYHNKKPDQIRGVFDASSRYQGISLNDVLLQGPDLLNGLLGILMRFRKDDVAISADIQQMFYAFRVEEKDRDFLRFFWYKDNNPDENLIEYRMKVHVFGNRPSPAVANLGLLKTAEASEHKFGKDVKDFVSSNFYVDDGLTSLPTPEKVIDLMKRTQAALQEYGQLRLHKVASNSQKVMTAFPAEDLAKDLASLDLTKDDLPLQRSLGLTWNLQKDFFTFDVSTEPKPFTRRGVLSTINSLYDPIGFVSPVTIVGKCLLKEMATSNIGWDEPLSSRYLSRWKDWTESLKSLQLLEIPRTYFSHSLSLSSQVDLYVFSDASEKAVASVAYLVSMHPNSMYETSFVMGKAKVAPSKGHTIPRLELCAAVLSTQITDFIVEHIGVKLQSVRFFTDSKVVLGYICNRTRRFYTYVSNRVERILSSSQASQWFYVDTGANPADVGSRGVDGNMLSATTWIKGPSPEVILSLKPSDEYVMQDPDTDKEVRPEIVTMTTKVSSQNIVPFGSHRFEKFSSFSRLVRAIGCLQHVSDSFARRTCSDSGWHLCPKNASRQHISRAESFVVKAVQYEWYKDEITCLKQGSPVPRNSPLLNLRPILDIQGVLRVGGRLGNSDLPTDAKNPMIIPGKGHLALLLIRHFHEKVLHQGRHFTEGAVRSGGYWITGGKRRISSVLIECYQCRRLRGKMQTQLMADLPASRINQALPFTYVGIDAFGPWSIVTRRTRGGQASNKRWAILFTCLSIRAVHIEIVEEMSASAFINALRRFIAIRGNVVEIRSDRGTNFRGSCEDLGIHAVNVEEGPVKNLLSEKNVSWVFNPPHASHMGGVWERMIGIVRNILDSMLLQHGQKNLTHDVLVTFMAEVCAIVNARPIVPVSSDSEVPEILSPSTLLTHKTEPPTSFNENLSLKDVYRSEWKRVQLLADQFWGRWKSEFLSLLQKRPKWATDKPNLKVGDVVLCRDKTVGRNQWPVALITETFPSQDTKVRSVRIKVLSDGRPVFYTRPVTELVLLVSGKE